MREFYIPGLILLHYDPDNADQILTRQSISKFKKVRNESTVYLCHNRVCQLPITSPDDLQKSLTEKYLANVLQG